MAGFQLAPTASKDSDDFSLGEQELPPPLARVQSLKVASGEIFVASSGYRSQLAAATGAQAVDMNLFGLETVCGEQSVPLFSWRIVSDRADDQAGETFRNFVAKYDGAGGRALAEVIRHLPANPSAPESYPELQKLLTPPTPLPTPTSP